MEGLKCERCGQPATHHTIDGADSKLICADYPRCKVVGMKRVYIAAPCGGGPDRDENRKRAARWCSWALRKRGVSPLADWIVLTSELSEDYRDLGMAANFAVLAACDEIWLVGGRVSPGMVAERAFALEHGIKVEDMTYMGEEPPE